MLENIFSFLDGQSKYVNGFTMVGVLLILFGVQSITRKDLKEYLRHRRTIDKTDRVIAWGIFYIIFGILILISSVLTISLYI